MLLKSDAPKLELVIVEKLPSNIISPATKLCGVGNVIVTVGDPLVVLNAFVRAVPDGLTKGCMS